MVSTLGLTRSNGSVSQAGNRSTSSSDMKARRSWATRSASLPVGVATTMGPRLLRWARPAITKARAGSGTASTALVAPARSAIVSSFRRSGGSEPKLTRASVPVVPPPRFLARSGPLPLPTGHKCQMRARSA